MKCTDYAKVNAALDAKLDNDTRKYLDKISVESYRVKTVYVVWPESCDKCGATPELGMGEIYFIRDGEMLCEECNEREED